MERSKEINLNQTGPGKFDICFCVIFSSYDQSLFPGKETSSPTLLVVNKTYSKM